MTENNTPSGIGFSSLLTTAFIVLKVARIIKWSWWWVFSPMWIDLAVYLLVLVVIEIIRRRR